MARIIGAVAVATWVATATTGSGDRTRARKSPSAIIGNRITVILNGVKIHDNVECNRATGSEIDGQVKEPGPIFLQGDHGTVSFRNIRIKELPN